MLDREQVESLKQPLLGQLIITGSLVVGALAASVVIYFIQCFSTSLSRPFELFQYYYFTKWGFVQLA